MRNKTRKRNPRIDEELLPQIGCNSNPRSTEDATVQPAPPALCDSAKDLTDQRWHQINVVSIDGAPGVLPKIIKRVGESPPQYPDEDEEECC